MHKEFCRIGMSFWLVLPKAQKSIEILTKKQAKNFPRFGEITSIQMSEKSI